MKRPSSADLAAAAASTLAIVTNPKPLDCPVNLSVTMRASTTAPCSENIEVSSASDIVFGRKPAYSFLSSTGPPGPPPPPPPLPLLKPSPARSRGPVVGSLLSRTCSDRPSTSFPCMPVLAAAAASGVSKCTNPKPRDAPVDESVMTDACVTVPNGSKTARSCTSVNARGRLPTKSFMSSSLFGRPSPPAPPPPPASASPPPMSSGGGAPPSSRRKFLYSDSMPALLPPIFATSRSQLVDLHRLLGAELGAVCRLAADVTRRLVLERAVDGCELAQLLLLVLVVLLVDRPQQHVDHLCRTLDVVLRVARDEHVQLLVLAVVVRRVAVDALLDAALASDRNLRVGLLLHRLLRIAAWPDDEANEVVAGVLLDGDEDFERKLARLVVSRRAETRVLLDQVFNQPETTYAHRAQTGSADMPCITCHVAQTRFTAHPQQRCTMQSRLSGRPPCDPAPPHADCIPMPNAKCPLLCRPSECTPFPLPFGRLRPRLPSPHPLVARIHELLSCADLSCVDARAHAVVDGLRTG
eukprot:90399-Chlamydomonas_euryale.AAC.1